MIKNDGVMRFNLPVPVPPTFDGSLFGSHVCRCGSHVDPHMHVWGDPHKVVAIYEEEAQR